MLGLLAVASLAVERGLQGPRPSVLWRICSVIVVPPLGHKLSSCGAGASLFRGMRDLPGPGMEPMSPALAGEFFSTAPPGKPSKAGLDGFLYDDTPGTVRLRTSTGHVAADGKKSDLCQES